MTSSLAKRVLTGVILAAVVATATLILPSLWFALLIAAFSLVGAWEWAGLAGWPSTGQRLAYGGASVLVLLATAWLVASEAGVWAVLLAGLVWWLVALAWVVRFQQGLPVDALNHPLVRLLAGWLVLAPAWGAVVYLHGVAESGPWLVLYLVFMNSTADSAAYFVGKRFGSRQLASNVSPGKSLEGLAGGLLAVASLAIVVALVADFVRPLGFVVLSLITALVSILGDLTESVVKRRAGLKDSGSIVPGHGGILDRIDSITAAAPIFVLGCLWQGGVL
ncbi:MAG: phosphatidate cytidylyltransferase [Proteobacteria bacterium]|nr:phosphatidate cytidylyltransferase [Pseudomonadota bacterium]